jgi:hypothetical protein
MGMAHIDGSAAARRSWPFDCCSRRGGLVCAALLGITGAFFTLASLDLNLGDFLLPGPGFFPFALGLLLFALSVAIFVKVYQEPREAPKIELGHSPVLIAFIAMCATAALFEQLGAMLTLTGFSAVMLVFVGRVRIIPAILSSTVGMLFVWYIFKTLLGVQLPAGPLAGVL